MNKRFAIILAVFVVLFAGLLIFGKRDNPGSNDTSGSSDVQPTEHKTGEGTTGVTLIEYGDFQCPACAQYFPILQQVKQKYGDQITFQFRHFPLTQIHQNALISSRAAEAAGMQGKFFEMHDLLYQNQQSWSESQSPSAIFEQFAQQLSLDIDKFREDMKSELVNDLVQADLREANKLELSSTPSFVLDGKKIDNPRSIEAFFELIDEAIASKQTQ